MTRSSLELLEKEKQQVTDELMMPAGEFGGLVIAALLLLVGFWGTSSIAHSVFPANASNHKLLMRFSWEKHSPLMRQVNAIPSLSHLPSGRSAPVTTEATASADGDAEETASPMNQSQAEEEKWGVTHRSKRPRRVVLRSRQEYSSRLGYAEKLPFGSW